jgi:hypothetical protein
VVGDGFGIYPACSVFVLGGLVNFTLVPAFSCRLTLGCCRRLCACHECRDELVVQIDYAREKTSGGVIRHEE